MWSGFLESLASASCCARTGLRPSVGERKGAFALVLGQGREQVPPGILVEVVCARNVPNLDASQEEQQAGDRSRKSIPGESKRPWLVDTDTRSDVYVTVAVLRAADPAAMTYAQQAAASSASAEGLVAQSGGRLKAVTETESTTLTWNSQNPVFHTWLHFPGLDSSNEMHIIDCRLMDFDQFTRDDAIGQIMVPVSDFQDGEEKICSVSLAPGVSPLLGDRGEGLEPLPCEVVLRCLRAWPERKRVFLIRHGESGWNKAMHDKDIQSLAHFDHPLSLEGVGQARLLNKAWSTEAQDGCELAAQQHEFLQASVVFSSPLTRAVQTCLIALQGHPALQRESVRLLASAREVNKLGGLDSIGVTSGEGIEARVRNELVEVIGEAETSQVMAHLDPQSCSTGEWWARAGTAESKQDISARISWLLSALVAAPGESCILVSHSLIICKLFQERCSLAVDAERKGRLERLEGTKLANAACCAVDLCANPTTGQIEIVDVKMMFGSCFEDGLGLDFEDKDGVHRM